MAYQMAFISVTLSELECHFCCYDWQNVSRSLCATAELLVQNCNITISL